MMEGSVDASKTGNWKMPQQVDEVAILLGMGLSYNYGCVLKTMKYLVPGTKLPDAHHPSQRRRCFATWLAGAPSPRLNSLSQTTFASSQGLRMVGAFLPTWPLRPCAAPSAQQFQVASATHKFGNQKEISPNDIKETLKK
jgi:hypothetical protein